MAKRDQLVVCVVGCVYARERMNEWLSEISEWRGRCIYNRTSIVRETQNQNRSSRGGVVRRRLSWHGYLADQDRGGAVTRGLSSRSTLNEGRQPPSRGLGCYRPWCIFLYQWSQSSGRGLDALVLGSSLIVQRLYILSFVRPGTVWP